MESGLLSRFWRWFLARIANVADIATIAPEATKRVVEALILSVSTWAMAAAEGMQLFAPFSYIIGILLTLILAHSIVEKFLPSSQKRAGGF